MDVFISWSGKHSRDVAVAFAEWLPAVLQRVRPFVSDNDIHSGARWQAEITGRLESCSFGVLIVTADNQTNPWLQFEAGALSKSVSDARVVPLLVDLKKSDLLLPLNMFQAESLDESGVTSLLSSMNSSTDEPMPDPTIKALASKWWPDLQTAIASIKLERTVATTAPERTDRELLEELVTMVRSMRNTSPTLASDEALQALREKLTGGADGSDDDEIERPRRSFVKWATHRLKTEGIVAKSVTFTGPTTITFDMGGQHVPGALADEIGRRGFKARLAVWFTHVEGQPNLHYSNGASAG